KPNLASVRVIGPSWQKTQNASTGYDLKVFKITNSATDAALPNKPTLVLFGSIHAREYAPAELVTRFAEGLVNGYGTDAEA
ncbi:peptidase M14, partial [Rhizobium sp. KAs_5_22]